MELIGLTTHRKHAYSVVAKKRTIKKFDLMIVEPVKLIVRDKLALVWNLDIDKLESDIVTGNEYSFILEDDSLFFIQGWH